MKMFASVDIGSNSVVLSICQKKDSWIEVHHESRVTELGRDLKTKKVFYERSFDKTIDALTFYKTIVEKYNIDPVDVTVVATEACRVAENRDALFDKIYQLLGAKVQLVSGEEEAKLCMLGQKMLYSNLTNGVIVDIGGSSTEVLDSRFNDGNIEPSFINSFKVGVVKLRDLSLENKTQIFLEESFRNLPENLFLGKKVFFSAGSMTALASILLNDDIIDSEKINGLCLDKVFVVQEIEKILEMDDNSLLRNYPQVESRIKTIKYGAIILKYFFDFKNLNQVIFTTYGLRHGALIQRYGE